MARPKAEFPRSERLVSRLTVAEAEQVRTSAEAAGLTTADFVRQRCGLDPAVVVTVENVRRWNPGGAVEQAQVDTHGPSPAGREVQMEAESMPSATGPASPRGASRPAPAESSRAAAGQDVATGLAQARRPQTAWDRHQQNEARKLAWCCSVPLCQENSSLKGARCPAHGVAMDVRGRA